MPPEVFARYISQQYVDTYVDGNFCSSSSYQGQGYWRTDVEPTCGYSGAMVEFKDVNGNVFAYLPWENWRLNYVRNNIGG